MTRLLLASATIALLGSTAFAQDMFLDNASIVDANGEVTVQDVRLTNGRISAITGTLSPADGEAVTTGAWVTHGLVASFSTLGIVDIGAERDTNDTSANTNLASASIKAADSFNPRESHIANARRRGIMYALVGPSPTGDTIFGGTGLLASLDGSDNSVLNDEAFVHVALGERGARRAGGSRGAAIQQLRGAFDDARRFFRTQDEADVLRRRDAQALQPVLNGDVPLYISASRASDLSRIIDLKNDFDNLDIIVIGAEEAHLIANDIASAGLKLVIDPLENLPDSFDSINASFDNVLAIDAAGIDYAIVGLSSLGTVKDGALNQHAGNAVGHGLSREAAMRAITSTPASWFGLDLGSIEAGQNANLIVWDGDPLEVTSAPIAMYQDGEPLSLESRMTALRDRYNPATDSDRPYKYR